jgi:hypothetical protein
MASSSSLATRGCWPFVFILYLYFHDFLNRSQVKNCFTFRIF